MVQDELNAVSTRVDGCETVVFVDLSTQMALMANEDTPESQDGLVSLTKEAALLLSDARTGFAAQSGRIHLFLKSETEPSDALCCVLKPGTDLSSAIPDFHKALTAISDDGAAS